MAYLATSSRVLECYADLGIADILGVIHEEVRRNNSLSVSSSTIFEEIDCSGDGRAN
jgi:hypothetical protein